MDQPHTISELLAKGRTPSDGELADLRQLGAFAASMYGRYLHGLNAERTRALGARPGDWARNLSGGLGAATATRWSEGIGLGSQLLADLWSGFWQVGAGGSDGYQGLDVADFEWIGIEEEEAVQIAAAPGDDSMRRRSRPSLFGKPTQPRRSRPSVADTVRAAKDGGRRATAPLTWMDGGSVSPEAIGALIESGLFVADQLAPTTLLGGAEGDASRANRSAAGGLDLRERGALGVPDSAVRSGPGLDRAAGFGNAPILLDGLRVDGRTPALASGLRLANDAFEPQGPRGTGLALTAGRAERLAELSPALAAALAQASAPTARPVYAFFDSVEGEFIALTDEVVDAGPPRDGGASVPTRRSARSSRGSTALSSGSFAAGTAGPSAQARMQPAPSVARLERIVPAAPATSGVRAYNTAATPVVSSSFIRGGHLASNPTGLVSPQLVGTSAAMGASGVARAGAPLAPTLASEQPGRLPMAALTSMVAGGDRPSPQIARQVAYTPAGLARARQQRSAIAAPRVALVDGQSLTVARGSLSGGDILASVQTPTDVEATQAIQKRSMEWAETTALPSSSRAQLTASAPQWRLAADAGPDLPLGAGLSRAEAFAGAVQLRQQPNAQSAFAPVVSREYGATAATTRWSQDPVLDGVVWVALGEETQGASARDLPMATVPSRRAATLAKADTVARLAHRATLARMAQATAPAQAATENAGWVARALGAATLGQGPVASRALETQRQVFGGSTAGPSSLVTPGLVDGVYLRSPMGAGGRFGLGDNQAGAGSDGSLAPSSRGDALTAGIAAVGTAAHLFARVAPRAGYLSAELADRPLVMGEVQGQADAVAEQERLGRSGATGVAHTAGRQLAGAFRGGPTAQIASTVNALRHARIAARRPVSTARESLSVLPALGSVFRHEASRATAARTQLPPLARLERGPEAFTRRASTSAGALGLDGADILSVLRVAGPEQRAEVRRALRISGWSEPELRMLELSETGTSAADVGEAALSSVGGVAGRTTTRSVGEAAGRSAPATTARSLARILTGAEALAGDAARMGGEAAAAIGRDLPMLSGKADAYFGALAPERSARAGVASSMTVRDAIGELLGLATNAPGMASDSPVPQSLRRAVLALASRDGGAAKATATGPAAIAQGLASSSLSLANAASRLEMRPGDRGISDVGRQAMGTAATGVSDAGAGATSLLNPAWSRRDDLNLVAAEPQRPSLEDRVVQALNASVGGPAGAGRLLSPLRQARVVGDSVSAGNAQPGIGGPSAASWGGAVARLADQSVALGSVLAPEVMLGGMRAPEVAAVAAGRPYLRETPGELAATFGVGERNAVPLSPVAEAGRPARGSRRGQNGDAASPTVGAQTSAALQRDGGTTGAGRTAIDASSPVAKLLRLIDPSGGRQVLGRSLAAGELGALVRQLGVLSPDRVSHDRAVGDFALAWAGRVDGARTGLNFGLSTTRSELLAFFRRGEMSPEGRVAAESPIGDAGFVAPAASAPRREARGGLAAPDRSRLRRVASHVQSSSAGASRPQHGASAAMRDLDWSYVNTGSTTSVGNANLGGLAASVVGESGSARVPMPLVAPAVKAVAQTALLSSRAEESPAARVSSSSAPAGGASSQEAATPAEAPSLTKEALEALAVEMADRIARRMKREKERTGWAF